MTLGYLPASGFWPLPAFSLGQAAALAPVTDLADVLALGTAAPPPASGRRGFEYGWVRGTGSAAFIGGTVLSGQAVDAWGLDGIVWGQALLLGAAAVAAMLVPERRAAVRPCEGRPARRQVGCLGLMRAGRRPRRASRASAGSCYPLPWRIVGEAPERGLGGAPHDAPDGPGVS